MIQEQIFCITFRSEIFAGDCGGPSVFFTILGDSLLPLLFLPKLLLTIILSKRKQVTVNRSIKVLKRSIKASGLIERKKTSSWNFLSYCLLCLLCPIHTNNKACFNHALNKLVLYFPVHAGIKLCLN